MCNLYSMTRSQTAIIELARAMRDTTGNLPPAPAIFPDQLAPVVFNADDGVRELGLLRWGMPCLPAFGTRPVTNVRNAKSPHWRRWLRPENRCLVPFSSFCEYQDTKPRKTPIWFALAEERPLGFFAGIWMRWHGVRGPKSNPVDGEHRLFAFLTCEPNAEVGAIHPQAMSVILTDEDEFDLWMTAPPEAALTLQRPLADGRLRIVATGAKQDGTAAEIK
jgi:putative SOS response-associated peptidase YedK